MGRRGGRPAPAAAAAGAAPQGWCVEAGREAGEGHREPSWYRDEASVTSSGRGRGASGSGAGCTTLEWRLKLMEAEIEPVVVLRLRRGRYSIMCCRLNPPWYSRHA